jgi:hypothetical protein
MARRPNYGQERSERQRRKALQREERLAAKAERREKNRVSNEAKAESGTDEEVGDPGTPGGPREDS